MDLKKISTFLSWAVFTFFSHYSAKLFLSNTDYLTENVIILTSLQMACGSLIFLKLLVSGEVKDFQEDKIKHISVKVPELNGRLIFLGICHLLGKVFNNN